MSVAFEFESSVSQLPIAQQLQEIDRRLRAVLNDCLQRGAGMTPAHIRVALGISAQQLEEYLQTEELRGRDAARRAERARLLQSWLERAELATVEAIGASPKNSAALFLARAVWHYSEKSSAADIGREGEGWSLEDLLEEG